MYVNHTCVKKIIRIRRNVPYIHKKRMNTYENKKYSNTSQRDERAVSRYVREVYEYTNTSQKIIHKKYERALNHYVGEEEKKGIRIRRNAPSLKKHGPLCCCGSEEMTARIINNKK